MSKEPQNQEPRPGEKLQYKNPPIVERNVGVYRSIPQGLFESRLPSWAEKIRQEYPVVGHLAEWMIDIEDRNGIPFVKSLEPKARIIHLFWENRPKHVRVHGMRLRPDRLVLHLLREDKTAHSFEEMLPRMKKWLPLWAEHFEITELDGVAVEYYNVLDGNLTPQFMGPNGALNVGEALTMFSHFPGRYKGITTPYDCKVRLVLEETKPTLFDLRVRADDRSQNAVRVDFVVRIFPSAKKLKLDEAISEIEAGHEHILEQFACFFTQNARESFDK